MQFTDAKLQDETNTVCHAWIQKHIQKTHSFVQNQKQGSGVAVFGASYNLLLLTSEASVLAVGQYCTHVFLHDIRKSIQ